MKPGKSTKHGQQKSSSHRSSASPSRLKQMISEAIVDCYNDSEQAMGLYNMIEEKLRLPFSTILLGIQVTVEKIDLNDAIDLLLVAVDSKLVQEAAPARARVGPHGGCDRAVRRQT